MKPVAVANAGQRERISPPLSTGSSLPPSLPSVRPFTSVARYVVPD